MYNRYIPQPDGSYRRNPIPESRKQPQNQPQRSAPPQRPSAPPPHQPSPPPSQPAPHWSDPAESIPGFLRQLIPQGFDTGDLIIVLLLLLIAGDSQENRSHALLTLALYFIM